MRCKFFFVIVICLMGASCANRLTKYYDFKDVKKRISVGEVVARLLGSFEIKKNLTIKASPYELFMSIKLFENANGNVTISNLTLKNVKNNNFVNIPTRLLNEELKINSLGDNCAYFRIKNLNLEYNSYVLNFHLKIRNNECMYEGDVELLFNVDYKEEKSNDILEAIMSV